MTNVDIAAVVEKAIERLREFAESKHVTLTFEMPGFESTSGTHSMSVQHAPHRPDRHEPYQKRHQLYAIVETDEAKTQAE